MVVIFQMLLRLAFSKLRNFLALLKIYKFDNDSTLARYFFDSDLRNHPKYPKQKTKFVHHSAFKPQKGETSLSVYNIENLAFEKIIKIGNKHVGKYKGLPVAGFISGSTNEINNIFQGTQVQPLSSEFWPLPHLRHINMSPKLDEPQTQLRGQLLAQKLSKNLLDGQRHSTQFF